MREKQNKPERAVLSLGSNLGRRENNLLKAADALAEKDGIILEKLSSLYQTEPVGGGYNRTFINAVALLRTSISPGNLLSVCQETERVLGGNEYSRGRDRILDIDLILYGTLTINTEELTIPHPRFKYRSFVVVPLMEVSPGIAIPPGNKRLSDTLDSLDLKGSARLASSRYYLLRS